MAIEYKFQGESFILDDSKGCYIEVTYKEQTGYMGVYLKGTAEKPLCWYDKPGVVTKDGLQAGNITSGDPEAGMQALCKQLLANHRLAEKRRAFRPEEVCKSLHEFVHTLPA